MQKLEKFAMNSKTILVTGASGFIGSRMLTELQNRGHRVIGLGRSGMGADRPSTVAAPAWIVADITDSQPIVLPVGIDAIVHLAGKAHALTEVAQDESEYFRINTEGTRHMLQIARQAGVRAFVLFSTVKAVGDRPVTRAAKPVDESWEAEPETPYGKSKRAAEQLVLAGGFVSHPVVLRPCLVYGLTPKGNLEKMISAVRRGRFPPLPEVGNKRSMVHVDDVIAATLQAIEQPAAAGQVYIVASNESFSTRQLFEWICEAFAQPVPRWTFPLWLLQLLGRVGDAIGWMRRYRFVFDSEALEKLTGDAWYSSAKLQRELGWRPRYTLRETLFSIVGSLTEKSRATRR